MLPSPSGDGYVSARVIERSRGVTGNRGVVNPKRSGEASLSSIRVVQNIALPS